MSWSTRRVRLVQRDCSTPAEGLRAPPAWRAFGPSRRLGASSGYPWCFGSSGALRSGASRALRDPFGTPSGPLAVELRGPFGTPSGPRRSGASRALRGPPRDPLVVEPRDPSGPPRSGASGPPRDPLVAELRGTPSGDVRTSSRCLVVGAGEPLLRQCSSGFVSVWRDFRC